MLTWQRHRSKQVTDGRYYHVTRMWPKREAELLDGGSIYWVIKGVIQCRQRILSLREITGQDGIRRCGLVLASDVIRTASVPKKAFQGWRYLTPADAPRPDRHPVAGRRPATRPAKGARGHRGAVILLHLTG